MLAGSRFSLSLGHISVKNEAVVASFHDRNWLDTIGQLLVFTVYFYCLLLLVSAFSLFNGRGKAHLCHAYILKPNPKNIMCGSPDFC